MYAKGLGVKQNKILAYQLLLKAAQQGHGDAQNNLDVLCRKSPWACR
jgi:TPR repeat protein